MAQFVERSLEPVVALLGILKSGAAYVPLDTVYPTQRLDFMIADAGVTAVATQDALRGRFTNSGMPIVCLDSRYLRPCARR